MKFNLYADYANKFFLIKKKITLKSSPQKSLIQMKPHWAAMVCGDPLSILFLTPLPSIQYDCCYWK